MKTTTSNQDNRRQDELRAMLAKLRDETYERVHQLRQEQSDDADREPGDEMDRARADADWRRMRV